MKKHNCNHYANQTHFNVEIKLTTGKVIPLGPMQGHLCCVDTFITHVRFVHHTLGTKWTKI